MIKKVLSAVVIPIYTPFGELTEAELLSLKSTCKHLRKYDHILVGPEKFNWKEYTKFFNSYNIDVSVKEFNKQFFTSIEGYSSLLKTSLFYKSFKHYEFILIFQLDAYIFKDALDFWCKKDYDYIGAPWFDTSTNEITGVGNGGFSLRKVDAAIRIIKRMSFLQKLRSFWFRSHLQAIIKFSTLLNTCRKYLKINRKDDVDIIHTSAYPNEDQYWSTLSNFFTDYKVAPGSEAIQFSFEVNPSLLYKKNNHQLPFGCHAWQKYEPQFWKEHICDLLT